MLQLHGVNETQRASMFPVTDRNGPFSGSINGSVPHIFHLYIVTQLRFNQNQTILAQKVIV